MSDSIGGARHTSCSLSSHSGDNDCKPILIDSSSDESEREACVAQSSAHSTSSSMCSVALFRSYFGEKVSGTSAVTAVIYAGTAQSLNGLAHELFKAVRSCRLAAIAFLTSKYIASTVLPALRAISSLFYHLIFSLHRWRSMKVAALIFVHIHIHAILT